MISEGRAMSSYLTGRYVDKEGALELLRTMNIHWTKRQIDWTAEPDHEGCRKWPWFKDPSNGRLLIDEGFIRYQYQRQQMQSLKAWMNNAIK